MSACSHRRMQAVAGFTLLESVVVMVLLAIVGAYALPRAFNASTMTLNTQARTLASDVQRAQLLATTTGKPTYVCITSTSYVVQLGPYAVNQPCPAIQPTQTSATQPVVVTLAHQATLTSTSNPLAFDSLGQPGTAVNFALQAAQDTHTLTVAIAAVTGAVTVTSP